MIENVCNKAYSHIENSLNQWSSTSDQQKKNQSLTNSLVEGMD